MSAFTATFIAVLTMLAYALPGYILIRRRMISTECIPGFSKVLLYVCQPFLAIHTFCSAEYSTQMLLQILMFAGACVTVQIIMLTSFFLAFRKKGKEDVRYRIATVSTAFANCAFFGIPIIETLLPENPEAILFTTVYSVIMNILGWSVGSAVITDNAKYIKLKNIFINPAMFSLIIAIPFFVTGVELYPTVDNMVMILARMSTPLSMLIIGMRLATIDFRALFGDWLVYLSIGIKQLIMPLVAFAVISLLPFETYVAQALYIMTACPVASIVLNFSEILGEGQKSAANSVLLGTLFSLFTLPIMSLLLPFLAR